MHKFDFKEIEEFILSQSKESKIYIGCDSERFKLQGQWFADYILAIVVHKDSKHGCKIFGEVQRERDYDQKASRPSTRLMTEVYKISELFLKLQDVLHNRDVEIHLDLNPDKKHASSIVVEQAIGYIKGTCNVVPMVKPNAWAASFCADRFKSLQAA
jgi:predicted RNase H-related nuclease YkuK (DUF458 family)